MQRDEASAYEGLPFEHEGVKYSVDEHVRGTARTNGMESFWNMSSRACIGTCHKPSSKHLERYVQESAGKNSIRDTDMLALMATIAAGLVGGRRW